MRNRGFTLVETLVGLLILTFIVTTSLTIVFERERRLRVAAETIAAYQALANEVEVQRHVGYEELIPGEYDQFSVEWPIIADFPQLQHQVKVEQTSYGIKTVTFTLRWREGQRHATVTMIRTHTGGSNLW